MIIQPKIKVKSNYLKPESNNEDHSNVFITFC